MHASLVALHALNLKWIKTYINGKCLHETMWYQGYNQNSCRYVKPNKEKSISNVIKYFFYRSAYTNKTSKPWWSSCLFVDFLTTCSKICACFKESSIFFKGIWKWVNVGYTGITHLGEVYFLQKYYCLF